MSAARRARMLLAGVRASLALLCTLGSVACSRPSPAGAQAGQIDLSSPGGPRWPGFDQAPEPPELTDADVERIATHVERARVPVPSAENPSKGPANARVTLQLYSDFECPFCVQVAPTLARIEQRYRGKLRLVWWNYPLPGHAQARPAARAALAAFELGGNPRFWQLHDWLYSPQADLSIDGLARGAARLGLDRARIAQAAQSTQYDQRIDLDIAAGDLAGIEGTPAVFINDYYMMGARHEAEYALVVERALREGS